MKYLVCAGFVLCDLSCFLGLGFVLFAGCVFIWKNKEKNVRKRKKKEDQVGLLRPESVIERFFVRFLLFVFWVAFLV
jgi:hypothetical protein